MYRIWDYPSSFFENFLTITTWKIFPRPRPISSIPPHLQTSPVYKLSRLLLWSCPRSRPHRWLTYSTIWASHILLSNTIPNHLLLFLNPTSSFTWSNTDSNKNAHHHDLYLLTLPFFTLDYSPHVSLLHPRWHDSYLLLYWFS